MGRHFKGGMGTPMHIDREKPKQVNGSKCPVCGAKKGETCIALSGTRFFELNVTHRNRGKQRGHKVAAPPMALDPRIK